MQDSGFRCAPTMKESEKMILDQLITLTNVYIDMQKDYLEIKEAMFSIIFYLKLQKKVLSQSILKKKKVKNLTKTKSKTTKIKKHQYKRRFVDGWGDVA